MNIKILIGIIYYVVEYNALSCDQVKQINIQSFTNTPPGNWKTEIDKFSFKK